jgi:hypothetical protein
MIVRRKDVASGRLEVSVPGKDITKVEAALSYLSTLRRETRAAIIIDLILTAARQAGWRDSTVHDNHSQQIGT